MGSERTTTMFKAKQWAFPCKAEALHEEHGPDFDTSKAFDKCSRKRCCYMFFGSSLSRASLCVSNLPLPFSCKDTCHQSQGPLRYPRGNSSLDLYICKEILFPAEVTQVPRVRPFGGHYSTTYPFSIYLLLKLD